MTRRLLVAIAAASLFVAACGDDDTAIDDPLPENGDAAPEDDTVTVAGLSFDPGTLEVDAGATVTWDSEDQVPHTVTSGSPGDPDGTFDEQLPAGESVEVSFDETGTFEYFCTIHPTMTAEIVVS